LSCSGVNVISVNYECSGFVAQKKWKFTTCE